MGSTSLPNTTIYLLYTLHFSYHTKIDFFKFPCLSLLTKPKWFTLPLILLNFSVEVREIDFLPFPLKISSFFLTLRENQFYIIMLSFRYSLSPLHFKTGSWVPNFFFILLFSLAYFPPLPVNSLPMAVRPASRAESQLGHWPDSTCVYGPCVFRLVSNILHWLRVLNMHPDCYPRFLPL